MQIILMYVLCVVGGILYVGGYFVMFYNLVKMIKLGIFQVYEVVEVFVWVVIVGVYKGEYWYCWIECCLV